MECFCEHPVVIFNPSLRVLSVDGFSEWHTPKGVYHFCDKSLPDLLKFMPRRCGLFSANYKDSEKYYVLNPVTGEFKPMYFVVPCGRCVLCRDRKVRELSCRVIAETNRWNKIPLFITFTYDDKHLPVDGLQKKDVQLFFKRIRSRLSYNRIPNELRYLAVGEYGSKTARPHYHMILWNFPDEYFHDNIWKIVRFIEKCWSVYDLDVHGKRIATGRCYRSGFPMYRSSQLGFIRVYPLKTGCAGYVLKYMKKCKEPPKGKNPNFMLASRGKGGIGRQWIESMKGYYHETPNCVSLPIVDKVISGKEFQCPITPYVKSVLSPSASRLVPRDEYDVMKRFMVYLDRFVTLKWMYIYYVWHNENEPDGWKSMFDLKYAAPRWQAAYERCKVCGYRIENLRDNYLTTLKNVDDFWRYYWEVSDELDIYSDHILEFPDYNEQLRLRNEFEENRSASLMQLFKDAPPKSVAYASSVLRDRLKASEHKEIF